MRIAIFTNCYRPLVNGVVGAVSLLRRGFIEQGHEVWLFAPAVDDYQDDEERVYRYPAVNLTNAIKYPVAIPFSPRIDSLLRDLELDIIHSHHPFVLGPVARRTARQKRVPIVYTFHTQYEQYSHYIPLPPGMVNAYSRRAIRRFCQTVDWVTTPAESARQILSGYGVTRGINVIPNPTLLSTGRTDGAAVREHYGIGKDKLLINIGRVAPEKNLGLLLEAFRMMVDQTAGRDLKLMIVGEGPARSQLMQQAEALGIADRVVFTGLVEPNQVPNYLAAADLFVMTSISEVKPLSQLEALAAGVPIVAVAAAGANDTIVPGENGLLMPLDAAAISGAVLKLIADPKRLNHLKQGAFQTAQRYAYPAIAGEYLQLFEKLLGEYQSAREGREG